MFNTRKMELLATAAGLAAGLALGLISNALAQAAKGDHWKEKADIPHSQIDGAEKADFSKKKAGKPVSGKEAENQEHMQRQSDGAAQRKMESKLRQGDELRFDAAMAGGQQFQGLVETRAWHNQIFTAARRSHLELSSATPVRGLSPTAASVSSTHIAADIAHMALNAI